MKIARKQNEHHIKAIALAILASSALFGQSGDHSTQIATTSPIMPSIGEVQTKSGEVAESAQTPTSRGETDVVKTQFIGKVQVHCAPLRASPQPDAIAIVELERTALLQVMGKEGEFYQVLPPEGLKAYVASRYVSNNSIIGEHVNIRSRPNTESAILGQLNTGNNIQAERMIKAPEWVEMPFPMDRKLYIRADLIRQVAGKETFEELHQLRGEILRALTEAQALNAEAQRQLVGDGAAQISWNEVRAAYEKAHSLALRSSAFTELSQTSEQQLQEAFLHYQTSFSEKEQAKKAHLELVPAQIERDLSKSCDDDLLIEPNFWTNSEQKRLEEWLRAHPEKEAEHYALDQQTQSQILEGSLVAFERPDLRQKPGDFILMRSDLPVAYLYSDRLDLGKLKGKLRKFQVVKRDDMGFALPAYCVISIPD